MFILSKKNANAWEVEKLKADYRAPNLPGDWRELGKTKQVHY